jgi:DNA-binding MarR family transcriptional regulator
MTVEQVPKILQASVPVTPTQKMVLVAVAYLADPSGRVVASQRRIGKIAGLSMKYTGRHLRALEDMGILSRSARWHEDGAREADLIVINWNRIIEMTGDEGENR